MDAQEWLKRQTALMEQVARGDRLPDVLQAICESVEAFRKGVRIAIVRAGQDQASETYTARSLWEQSNPVVSYELAGSDGILLGRLELSGERIAEDVASEKVVLDALVALATLALARERDREVVAKVAQSDDLTGLSNRQMLWRRLDEWVRHREDGGAAKLSLLFIDIDCFRTINDQYGMAIGDAVLREMGRTLQARFSDAQALVRLGGDEFVVVWAGDVHDLRARTEQMVSTLRLPMVVEGRAVKLTISAGIAPYHPSHGLRTVELVKEASAAAYFAKARGRNNIQIYTEAMASRLLRRHWLAEQLMGALTGGQLSLVYQPKQDVRSGVITGVEALLRWTHPEVGAISPAEFIPVAEESGLIVSIGDWVLQSVCNQLVRWHRAGWSHLMAAVNVSARQFAELDFLAKLVRVLESSGVSPAHLQLEITETTLMERTESMQDTLQALRKLGVTVAIDDFGIAYSSLGYLQQFAVDVLKIDQSFIGGIASDRDALVTAIIALGHSLRLRVVAEGVETEAQLAFLRERKCDEAQGYLLARPMTPQALESFLDARLPKLVGQTRDA